MSCCLRLFLNYPVVILVIQAIVGITCAVVIVLFGELPNYEDPTLGFAARGTTVSDRLRTYRQLIEKTDVWPSHWTRRGNSVVSDGQRNNSSVIVDESNDGDDLNNGVENGSGDEEAPDIGVETYFCGIPNPDDDKEYAKVVFESQDGGTLWTAEKIRSMCQLEDLAIRSHGSFESICVRTTRKPGSCCRSWSVGNYVALLANKSSCGEIVDRDVEMALDLLRQCAVAFRDRQLPSECWDSEIARTNWRQCGGTRSALIPRKCLRREAAVYYLFYLVDRGLVEANGDVAQTSTSYVASFLPVVAGPETEVLYFDFQSHRVSGDGVTRVVALDFDLKQHLFEGYLVRDSLWFAVALIGVSASLTLYARSTFIALATFFVIIESLGAAYLFYTFVFGMRFFPFMNLLAALILVGIGVDDAFVYLEAWSKARCERDSLAPDRLVSNALRHATPSAFASSATTAAAFVAGAVASDVVVLRCFGVFACTAVVLHFILLATTMPAVIVIHDRYCTAVCSAGCCDWWYRLDAVWSFFGRVSRVFTRAIPHFVSRFRILVLSVLGSVGIVAALVVFVYPRLRLPTSSEFQLFTSDHLFEVYDLRLKSRFWFADGGGGGDGVDDSQLATMPLRVVFGVRPEDSGSRMDPKDDVRLKYDEGFNVGTPAARQFLSSFCRRLRGSRYYRAIQGFQLTECIVENFERFMERGCEDFDGGRLEPCCGMNRRKSNSTYSSEVFDLCLKQYLPSLYQTSPIYSAVSRDSGLRFDKVSGKLVGLVVEFLSVEPYSANYSGVGAFFDYMDAFVTAELSAAPAELRSGFFISEFEFFDLQQAIATGTPAAIGLAIGASMAVALVTTVNVVVAFYAMLTVSASIFVTAASLVGLGWTLNVVESVTVSVAVGLSVDFALHHAVAYRLANPRLGRRDRVLAASASIAAPVSMSAATTFLVGLSLMPSTVLAYRQLGAFLMIVITASWTYATFFLQALLDVAGPLGRFGQLTWSPLECCRAAMFTTTDGGTPRVHRIDRNVYAVENSVVTSSSNRRDSDAMAEAELDRLKLNGTHLLSESSVP